MQKHIFFIITAILLSAISFGQSVLTGRVTDAETKLPLEGASVFAQNTTIGAITNADGHFKLSLSKGGYEYVLSFTGYVTHRANVETYEEKQLEIQLVKEDISKSAWVMTSSYEVPVGWEK